MAAHIAGAGTGTWDAVFAKCVLLFHMPLFFVVSGYVYKPASSAELFWKKISSLAVPYVAFLTVLTFAVISRRILLGDVSSRWQLREMAVNDALGGMRLWRDFGVFWL
ncbi:acyltransferase family protein [Mesorhizobium sp. 2RAF45]|uniref:acyltransferase family protein n=1 Tax=Mesorhizobium sp. 2RAF45 TaxID=3233001 RepID=UPI003F9C30DB